MGLKCASSSANDPCAATQSPGVLVSGAAVQVVESVNGVESSDTATAPKIAVGGVRNEMANDPKTGAFVPIEIKATDAGSGLAAAIVQLDGYAPKVVPFTGGTNCVDLTPATTTVIDMPMDAVCPTVDTVTVGLDTSANKTIPNGTHRLRVGVWDWSGRYTELRDESIAGDDKRPVVNINNDPFYGSPTADLNISTGATNTPAGFDQQQQRLGRRPGRAAHQLAARRACRSSWPRSRFASPRAARSCAHNKRYRFTGRLTCVINGSRVSAPKRARIDLLNTVGKKTLRQVGHDGRRPRAPSRSSWRTGARALLIFRFTNADGQQSAGPRSGSSSTKKKKSKR